MLRFMRSLTAGLILFTLVSADAREPAELPLRQQVEDTERAFAASMAERDFEAFESFLSDEAVFFSGETALRGREQIAAAWKPYFEGPDAPFSWEPRQVEVLDSGTLALSSGPVWNPAGVKVATFTSIWRLEAGGKWRIIFDKGNRSCDEPEPGQPDASVD